MGSAGRRPGYASPRYRGRRSPSVAIRRAITVRVRDWRVPVLPAVTAGDRHAVPTSQNVPIVPGQSGGERPAEPVAKLGASPLSAVVTVRNVTVCNRRAGDRLALTFRGVPARASVSGTNAAQQPKQAMCVCPRTTGTWPRRDASAAPCLARRSAASGVIRGTSEAQCPAQGTSRALDIH